MSDATRILNAIAAGDPQAAAQLLPLVYEELRRLAAAQMAQEKPGQTLDATALVHEAFLRLAGHQQFANRAHFFAAAAEAMRRILVEQARAKKRLKRGGAARREDLDADLLAAASDRDDETLAVHEALGELEKHDAQAAALVKLRFFAGFGHQEAAHSLGLERRAADRLWLLARAWLFQALRDAPDGDAAEGLSPPGGRAG